MALVFLQGAENTHKKEAGSPAKKNSTVDSASAGVPSRSSWEFLNKLGFKDEPDKTYTNVVRLALIGPVGEGKRYELEYTDFDMNKQQGRNALANAVSFVKNPKFDERIRAGKDYESDGSNEEDFMQGEFYHLNVPHDKYGYTRQITKWYFTYYDESGRPFPLALH